MGSGAQAAAWADGRRYSAGERGWLHNRGGPGRDGSASPLHFTFQDSDNQAVSPGQAFHQVPEGLQV